MYFLLVKKCGGCSPHATCNVTSCVCNMGYTGDGTTCQRKYLVVKCTVVTMAELLQYLKEGLHIHI